MLLTNARNTSLKNSTLQSRGPWSRSEHVGEPGPAPPRDRPHVTAASVAVAVERMGTLCTLPGLPESSSTWFWIMLNQAAAVGSPGSDLRLVQLEFLLHYSKRANVRLLCTTFVI